MSYVANAATAAAGPRRPPRTATAEMLTAAEKAKTNWLNGKPFSPTYYADLEKTAKFPVYGMRGEFLKMYQDNDVTIIVAETGSGKSTLLPGYILFDEDPRYEIACTQPRQMAVEKVAGRVSRLLDVTIGDEVGYRFRGTDKTTGKTRLSIVTDGLLLKLAQTDASLKKYGCIIIDEAHERGANSDLLLGILKHAVKLRRDTEYPLKVVVMSATIDEAKFCAYFDGAPSLFIPGRAHEVEIQHLQNPCNHRLTAAVNTITGTILPGPPGDVLVFVPTASDIFDGIQMLRSKLKGKENFGPVNIHSLTAKTPYKAKLQIEAAPPVATGTTGWGRNVTFATPVAQTSITLERVDYVVDCGTANNCVYDPRDQKEYVRVVPISKADADQRAGRAGRVRPGKCFRMYTLADYDAFFPEQIVPELHRVRLTQYVLTLLRLGHNPLTFDYLDAPSSEAMSQALGELSSLGLLEPGSELQLNQLGILASKFSFDPHHAVALLHSDKFGCSTEVASIIAMIQATSTGPMWKPTNSRKEEIELREIKAGYQSPLGDHLTMLNVFYDFMLAGDKSKFCQDKKLFYGVMEYARNAVTSYLSTLKYDAKIEPTTLNIDDPSYYSKIAMALCTGLFLRFAVLADSGASYKTTGMLDAFTQDGSSIVGVAPENRQCVIYESLSQGNLLRMDTVTGVKMEWLLQAKAVELDPQTFPDGSVRNTIVATVEKWTDLSAATLRGPVYPPR